MTKIKFGCIRLIAAVVALFAACAATLSVSADTLTFGAPDARVSGQEQIAPGTVATSIKAYVNEGETLVLTNGDITLNAPVAGERPVIAADGGALRVASALTAPDGLLVTGDSEMLVQTEFYPNAYNHSITSSLFAEGKNIDDYAPAMGKIIRRLSDITSPLDGRPYCVRRSPGELTFEMQCIDTYLRVIKVRLFQVGADIHAQVLWGRYASAGLGYGYSLENAGADVPIHSKTHQMTQDNQTWFGVHTLALVPNSSASSIRLSGDLSVSGGMAVDSAFATLEGSGTIANDLAIPLVLSNSTLRVCRDADTTLSANVDSFNGTLAIGNGNGDRAVEVGEIASITASQTTLFKNALIDDLEITGSRFISNNGAVLDDDKTWFGFYDKKAGALTFQVQGSQTWNKGVVVELWQEGSNIVGRVAYMRYANLSTWPGLDMRIPGNYIGTGNYAVTNVTYTLKSSPKVCLAGTATSGVAMSVVVESNAVAKVDSLNAVPSSESGSVTVEHGGQLWWRNAGSQTVQKSFHVSGGLFYLERALTDYNVYDLEGGTLALYNLGPNNSTSEAGSYLNKMSFRDSARLTGRRPRIGGTTSWTVAGNAPSFWETGGRLVGGGNASTEGTAQFTLDVADVTGDGDADFISTPATMSGFEDSLFTDFDANTARLKIVKTGDGTWEWRAKGGTWTGRLVVNAGAVRFTKSETLAADGLGVQLGGGELDLSAGTTNAIPKFVVAADSSLRLGADAVVTLPAPGDDFASGTEIADGVSLDIVGPEVPERERTGVRIGTSDCLDAAILKRLRYNDSYVHQDAEGYLRIGRSGGLIIFVH